MIFIMNTEGTITAVTSSPLYQGSSDVNKIVLLAPFAQDAPVLVSFRLPNGQYVYPYFARSEGNADNPYRMVLLESFSGRFFTEDGKTGYNAWSINVDYPLTQYPGVLTIQFAVGVGNGYLTSSTPMITVERGNEYLPPSIADDEALGTLYDAVEAAQTAASNASWSESATKLYSDNAEQDAYKAERYAVGEQDGVEVEGGIGYQNNAKYYAEQAKEIGDHYLNVAKEIGDYYLNETSSKADEAAASAEAAQGILDDIEFISGLDASDYYTKSEVDEKDEAIEDAVSALDTRLTVVEGRKVYAHKVEITLTADTYTSSNPYPLAAGGVWGFKLTTTIYNSDPTPFTFDQIYMGATPFGSPTVNTMAWTGEINYSGTSSSNKLCKVITARRYPASSSYMLSLIICQMAGTATIYKVTIRKDALEVTDTVSQYE